MKQEAKKTAIITGSGRGIGKETEPSFSNAVPAFLLSHFKLIRIKSRRNHLFDYHHILSDIKLLLSTL
ncbi:MAG: hypothetical protein ACJ71G_05175 [Nitrososphaeraceae archaeon]